MSYSSSSSVPIEMLPGIGVRTAKVLRSWQIRTVGQFKQMPERVIVELFGPSIRPVYQAVQGQPVVRQRPQPRLQRGLVPQHHQSAPLSFVQKLKLASTLLTL